MDTTDSQTKRRLAWKAKQIAWKAGEHLVFRTDGPENKQQILRLDI